MKYQVGGRKLSETPRRCVGGGSTGDNATAGELPSGDRLTGDQWRPTGPILADFGPARKWPDSCRLPPAGQCAIVYTCTYSLRFVVDTLMLCELTTEEFAAALDAIAGELISEAAIDEPPVDTLAVAHALGITIADDDRQQGRARYVRLSGHGSSRPRATILLRGDPRRERRQWAVAHEIGEYAAHRVFAALGVNPREAPGGTRETVANQLAGRLLLPGGWFAADGVDFGWDLLRLKARYWTASHELIARRMLECPPAVIVSIFDQGRLYFRRCNLGGGVPPVSQEEMNCRQTAHDYNRPQQCNDGLHVIQAWPIHEDGWRREILRTEVEEGR